MKILLALAAVLSAMPLSPSCAAQTFHTIYQFGPYPDAQTPVGLAEGPGGALVGPSAYGGIYGYGALFEVQPPVAGASGGGTWTETVLYSFAPQNGDGQYPVTSPVMGANGAIFGTTGYASAFGASTLYELQPPAAPGGAWTGTVLLDLLASLTNPVPGQNGKVYALEPYGNLGCGAILRLAPPPIPGAAWIETVLFDFLSYPPTEPCFPDGLIMAANGVLYGVTEFGGISISGVVFESNPTGVPSGAWTLAPIYQFTGGADGGKPTQPPVIGIDGAIYGTTSVGGTAGLGTVFQLSPPDSHSSAWTETTLYSFTNSATGVPSSPLIVRNGRIYGTTATVYASTPGGSVFELQPPATPGGPWVETTLYQFTSGDQLPSGSLVLRPDGLLCGTTNGGINSYGELSGNGTVYCITGIQGGSQ